MAFYIVTVKLYKTITMLEHGSWGICVPGPRSLISGSKINYLLFPEVRTKLTSFIKTKQRRNCESNVNELRTSYWEKIFAKHPVEEGLVFKV